MRKLRITLKIIRRALVRSGISDYFSELSYPKFLRLFVEMAILPAFLAIGLGVVILISDNNLKVLSNRVLKEFLHLDGIVFFLVISFMLVTFHIILKQIDGLSSRIKYVTRFIKRLSNSTIYTGVILSSIVSGLLIGLVIPALIDLIFSDDNNLNKWFYFIVIFLMPFIFINIAFTFYYLSILSNKDWQRELKGKLGQYAVVSIYLRFILFSILFFFLLDKI